MIVLWKCANTKNEPCAVVLAGTSDRNTPVIPHRWCCQTKNDRIATPNMPAVLTGSLIASLR